MSEALEKVKMSPELRHRMRTVINDLYLISEIIPDRESALVFNSLLSLPLMTMRKRFELASGNVVKVARKPASL